VKGTVCLDFDGVMNTYTGWKGADHLYEPRDGLRQFLESLREVFRETVVHTTRPAQKVRDWLTSHDLTHLVDRVTDTKPPAHCYLDDRAVRFDGDFEAAFRAMVGFKAYWEKEKA
jgi:hypothetical protein